MDEWWWLRHKNYLSHDSLNIQKKTLKLLLRRTLVWWTSMFSITQNIAHLIKCASQINIHAYLHLIQPITYNKSINENCPIKIIKSILVRLSFFSVSWFNNLIVCMSYMINVFLIHMNWIKIAYHFICAIWHSGLQLSAIVYSLILPFITLGVWSNVRLFWVYLKGRCGWIYY